MVVYKHDGTEEVIKYAVVLSLLSLLLLLRGFLFLGSLDDQNVDCTDRCFGRINSQGATHTDNTQPAIGRKEEEEEEEEEEERGGRRAGRGEKKYVCSVAPSPPILSTLRQQLSSLVRKICEVRLTRSNGTKRTTHAFIAVHGQRAVSDTNSDLCVSVFLIGSLGIILTVLVECSPT